MQIEWIRAFLQLCEDKNITKSGAALNISQQGLSRQLKSMEQELGFPLFQRNSRSMTLTAKGSVLVPYFQEIARLYDGALKAAGEPQQNNVLKLGFSQTATTALGLSFISRYQLDHPDITFQISNVDNESGEQMLLDEDLDGLFCFYPRHMKDFRTVLVHESRCLIVVRKDHPLAQKEAVYVDDLAGQNVYLPDKSFRMRQILDQYFPMLVGSFKGKLVSSEPLEYVKLPAQTGGVALAFEFQCKNLPDSLTTRYAAENYYGKLYYCTPKKASPSPVVRDFSAYVRDNLQITDEEENPKFVEDSG